MTKYSIGVDLGATNLRVAAIDISGRIMEKTSMPSLFREPYTIINDIVSSIGGLQERFGNHQLMGVGVGVAGFIFLGSGIIADSPNLAGFNNFPIRVELEDRLHVPVFLENDANASALGEKWMGSGCGINNFVLIATGTGIGAGIIAHGKILHGFMGMAGEIGHMTVFPGGSRCGCDNYGCLEQYASGTGVMRMAKDTSLGNLTSAEVYELAITGDITAQQIFVDMGRALGISLAALINLLNFPLYLIGGGLLPAWDLFATTMMEEVHRRSFVFRNTETKIEKALLQGDSCLYGAAYLPLKDLLDSNS